MRRLLLALLASTAAPFAAPAAGPRSAATRRPAGRPSPSGGGASPLKLLELFGGGPLPSLQPVVVGTAKAAAAAAWGLAVSELAPQDADGAYARPVAAFSSPPGRSPALPLVLYVGNACPWCHRALLVRAARRLPSTYLKVVELVADPTKASRGGWIVDTANSPDPLFGAKDLREVYDGLEPGYVGRCTAPLLAAADGTPVSNESDDIMRLLNQPAVAGYGDGRDVDLRPAALDAEIEKWAETLYEGLNNGVYRCGFATSQKAYDAAAAGVIQTLDVVEGRLSESRFLCGDRITDADLRLHPTVSRYDACYAGIFKCGFRRVGDFPNTAAWLRDMDEIFAAGTVDVDAAAASYYDTLFPLNPSGIVPTPPLRAPAAQEGAGRGPQDPEAVFWWR